MTDPERTTVAGEAWRAILDFIGATAWRRTRILSELGLSVSDSRALSTIPSGEGRTMRSLAAEWSCDASTATWLVDRLERRGLAERHAHATDRRLRLVNLTAAGVELRDEMLRRMYTPPPELLALDPEDLAAIRDGTRRLPGPTEISPPTEGPGGRGRGGA